jgi:hypothetical protein
MNFYNKCLTSKRKSVFSPNFKAFELRRAPPFTALDLADITVHAFLNCGDKCLHFLTLAFGFSLHASVGQVADKAGDIKLRRNLQHGNTETDTLDVSGKKYCLVMNFSHE